ncbi:hypothetical protein [Hydrogenophaga intermedia]|uniref:hypothetical protein n=1 Tax=Hydrogenophaga intermedia TaxID=65786 RepID=UPI002042C394|nr:hypothetical protein [Hydrogenophaga intermedia]MCM3565716.1 hypothetical protein [Hydrogenophaga intermedia]
MSDKEYLIAQIERNGIHIAASGHSTAELTEKLKDSLRLWLAFNEASKNPNSPRGPADISDKAQILVDEAIAEGNCKIFKLTAMGELFEGRRKISELTSKNETSDAMRYFACLWQITKSNKNAGGVLSAIPTPEELRWLVTDTGFFITRQNPSPAQHKYADERKQLVKDFIQHFEVAYKFGAPPKVLAVLAGIVKDALTKLGEEQGNYNHLSISELEEKLIQVEGAEKAVAEMAKMAEMESLGISFKSPKLSSEELRGIIAKRKSEGNSDANPLADFNINSELRRFMDAAAEGSVKMS